MSPGISLTYWLCFAGFEPNNFLNHLTEVETLGTILRAYAIRLFFTPNYILAPQQEVADKLYTAVPDFGGYLLKVGSEGQGGIATPENINAIAKVLRRAPGSGQKNGTAVVRGFIYGSTYCKDHDEKKTNRMAIPAMFFKDFDGQYDENVFIMGKYSALDCQYTGNPHHTLISKGYFLTGCVFRRNDRANQPSRRPFARDWVLGIAI